MIIAHNHPTGNVEPSEEDIHLTVRLLQGAQFLSIPLLDHLILGNGDILPHQIKDYGVGFLSSRIGIPDYSLTGFRL